MKLLELYNLARLCANVLRVQSALSLSLNTEVQKAKV